MAKEETTENDAVEGEEAEAGKGGKLKIVWMALAAILLIGGSVAGTLFFIGGDEEEVLAEEEVESSPRAIYYAINPEFRSSYVVNGRQRLFQIGLTLVTRNGGTVDVFATHTPAIRNQVVMLLSGQSFEDLQKLEGREALRSSLLSGIQDILKTETGEPGVESVLFTQFVMQ